MAHISEIPAGKALKPQKHMFEELIYIVSGHGATTVWNDPASKHTFEWQRLTFFSAVKYLVPTFQWQRCEGKGDVDVKLGGNQIEYEDEDSIVPRMFQEACLKAGVKNLMEQYYKKSARP